jgi:hypothetical protein
MNRIERLVAFALFLMPVLWAPASSFAQNPFDGTWRFNLDQSKLSPKPEVFSVNKGMYDCSSCNPKIDVKADGRDQSVTGQIYDTISVREVGPKSIAVTTKKSGSAVSEQTRTVSDDGNTLTVKIINHALNSNQAMRLEYTATRVGKAPAGANGTSGAWQNNKVKESEKALTRTCKSSGDEQTVTTSWGESFTAKLDGKDYPFKGSYRYTSVSLRRVDDRTIEQTAKRDGKVVDVVKITVSADGKKLTEVMTSKLTGRTTTFVAEKQ